VISGRYGGDKGKGKAHRNSHDVCGLRSASDLTEASRRADIPAGGRCTMLDYASPRQNLPSL